MGARSAFCITTADYWTVINTLNLTDCRRHTSNKLIVRKKKERQKEKYLQFTISISTKESDISFCLANYFSFQIKQVFKSQK